MAHWQTHLRLGDVYRTDKPIQELAAIVAQRLRSLQLPPLGDSYAEQRDEIADEFEGLAGDKQAEVHEFDDIMQQLYDWADTPLDTNWNGKKLCWVDTFAPAKVSA